MTIAQPTSVPIRHVFFDIGGVLGSNGWDREQRATAVQEFNLKELDFEYRHLETVSAWEEGRMSLDEYLDITVFYEPRPFTKQRFTEFMFAQSQPFLDSIDVVKAIRAQRRVVLMTLNNESAELNAHRIERFGLRPLFDAFLTSCWLNSRKPASIIYQRAVGVAQADPRASVFVDDREQNLGPARQLGMRTILFHDAAQLSDGLRSIGVLA
ncbi:MAG: HAD family phosphatase [Gemmatimonadota bacterium]|nr:HAD family phosphatase [Gemmatimonadota bacterium]